MNRGLYTAHGTLRYKWESEKISTGRPLLPVTASIGNPFLYSEDVVLSSSSPTDIARLSGEETQPCVVTILAHKLQYPSDSVS